MELLESGQRKLKSHLRYGAEHESPREVKIDCSSTSLQSLRHHQRSGIPGMSLPLKGGREGPLCVLHSSPPWGEAFTKPFAGRAGPEAPRRVRLPRGSPGSAGRVLCPVSRRVYTGVLQLRSHFRFTALGRQRHSLTSEALQ